MANAGAAPPLWEAGQLPIETMDGEQYTAKRERRALSIQVLKPDTEVKKVQAKMAQDLHHSLSGAEDILRNLQRMEPAPEGAQLWLETLRLQRRGVTELTRLLSQLRLAVNMGAEAVAKVYHSAGGDEDMTEEEKRMLKEYNKEKEKEQKEWKQQQATAAKQAENLKWTGGRGRGGYRQNPYYYGGGQQYSQPAQQIVYVDAAGQPIQQQPVQYARQPVQQQQGGYQQMQGGYQQPPQLMRAPGPRPQARANAMCFRCGLHGHFVRDGQCLQADVDAFQATLRQQVAIGADGGAQAGAAPGGQAQIGYVPQAPDGSG